MISRVTLVTAPMAIILGFAVFTTTDLPDWVAVGIVVFVGGVVPVVYESFRTRPADDG